MTDDLKTKIAEAICRVSGGRRCGHNETSDDELFDALNRYRDETDAALQGIHDAGFAVVPLVPTEAMLEAGFVHTADPCWIEDVAKAYRAMVSAAQHNTEEKT